MIFRNNMTGNELCVDNPGIIDIMRMSNNYTEVVPRPAPAATVKRKRKTKKEGKDDVCR